MYSMLKQVSRYVDDNESQFFFSVLKKGVTNVNLEVESVLWSVRLELEALVCIHAF